MIEFKRYDIDFETMLKMPYKDVVIALYDAIPSHDMSDLTPDEARRLLGYYPDTYSVMSMHFSLLLELYRPRTHDKIYFLKGAYEQALKVVKFQYDGLSRKITVDKDEEKLGWSTKK
jgi:hypothetical protein